MLRAVSSTAPVTVVLAAGGGTRLRDGSATPKPLVDLAGATIAEHLVRVFHAAGVRELVVVVGSEAGRVSDHFMAIGAQLAVELRCVEAAEWSLGNGASAAAAEPAVAGRPFLLTMVDHLFVPAMIERVIATPPESGAIALAVDRDHKAVFDLEDLTKVELENGQVARIGKQLARWNAGDTGLFHCTEALFQGLRRARERGGYSLSDGVRECIADGGCRAIDVTGHPWIDVDTPEAFAEAERRIGLGLF